jgi:hypothetical protein
VFTTEWDWTAIGRLDGIEPSLLDMEISQRFRLEGTIIVTWSIAWLRRVEVWGEPLTARRLAIYLTGCLIFALGSDFFIASNLGTDPLDVFVLGLRKHIPMTIGMGQAGVAVICGPPAGYVGGSVIIFLGAGAGARRGRASPAR